MSQSEDRIPGFWEGCLYLGLFLVMLLGALYAFGELFCTLKHLF